MQVSKNQVFTLRVDHRKLTFKVINWNKKFVQVKALQDVGHNAEKYNAVIGAGIRKQIMLQKDYVILCWAVFNNLIVSE